MLIQFDATDEESPLLHSDFTNPNFCCRVDLRETPTKSKTFLFVHLKI